MHYLGMDMELQPLSTRIDARVREALNAYCQKRGLKLRHVIEEAIVDHLEDEIDFEAYQSRKDEVAVPLEELLADQVA